MDGGYSQEIEDKYKTHIEEFQRRDVGTASTKTA